MAVDDAVDSGILLVYLAVDIPLHVSSWRRGSYRGSIGDVIFHKITHRRDVGRSHIAAHNKDIGVCRVSE